MSRSRHSQRPRPSDLKRALTIVAGAALIIALLMLVASQTAVPHDAVAFASGVLLVLALVILYFVLSDGRRRTPEQNNDPQTSGRASQEYHSDRVMRSLRTEKRGKQQSPPRADTIDPTVSTQKGDARTNMDAESTAHRSSAVEKSSRFDELTMKIQALDAKLGRLTDAVDGLASSRQPVLTQEFEGEVRAEFRKLTEHLSDGNGATTNAYRSLTNQLEELIAHRRTLQLLRARRVQARLDKRKQSVFEAAGPRAVSLMQFLADFDDDFREINFPILDNAFSHLSQQIESHPDYRGVLKLREQAARMTEVEEIADRLVRMLEAGDVSLAEAELELGRIQQQGNQVLSAPLPESCRDVTREIRKKILEDIKREYMACIENRTSYDVDVLRRVLDKIDVSLTKIQIGQTKPDHRLHEVVMRSHDERWPPGTIVNVLSMGYEDRLENHVVKAKVAVNKR